MIEREIKFKITNKEQIKNLNLNLSDKKLINMQSVYYDTTDNFLQSQKCGLRLRQENESSVCCLKIDFKAQNGIFSRREYECPADTIYSGIKNLSLDEANEAILKNLLNKDLKEICRINFQRTAYLLTKPDFLAEACIDDGYFSANDKNENFLELEIEFKQGDVASFETFCSEFALENNLITEDKSKLLRGILLKNS